MNYVKYIFSAISLLAMTSCNQGKIDELEYEVLKLENEISELENENEALKSYIEELENEISNYKSYNEQYSAQQKQSMWHKQIAQQHLQTAEFWRENGDEFLYESSMRNAQQELDMIP